MFAFEWSHKSMDLKKFKGHQIPFQKWGKEKPKELSDFH